MPFFDSGNGEVYYEVHGTGPTLVLVHGLGGNHAIWWRQIEYFARNYQVVTYDAQGFGLSRIPSLGKAPGARAKVLLQLLDLIDADEVALVGQSMGGYTAWEVAARHPERVRLLVMSASNGPLSHSTHKDIRARSQAASSSARELTQPERVFAPHFIANRPADVLLYTQISSFGDVTQARLAGELPPVSPPIPDDLPDVKVPTLFVAGRDDSQMPVDVMRDIAELAGAGFVELPLAGHSPFFECPEEYNFIIEKFLLAHGWGTAEPDPIFGTAASHAPV